MTQAIDPSDPASRLAERMEAHRAALARMVEREAGGLLKKESVDDVLQGLRIRLLGHAEGFEYRGEPEFLAFARLHLRQHVIDRQRYHAALRRQGGHMLRVSVGGQDEGRAGIDPVGRFTGPMTHAMRREMVELAARAVETLLPRDQELVRLSTEGFDLDEIARRMDLNYDAAEAARRRAMERFRKAFELLTRG